MNREEKINLRNGNSGKLDDYAARDGEQQKKKMYNQINTPWQHDNACGREERFVFVVIFESAVKNCIDV